MKYGDVCTGISASTVAWAPLGFQAQFYSEIEPFPSKLLKHYYPNVPNLGDMTKILDNETFQEAEIDLLVGGTPCQSFSVAGLRGGLSDDRGNLALQFCKILGQKRPKWFVWENVPGVLSVNEGKDFTCILDAFEELGYICDIDILDAQFFGVPQRRRRVFVCGQSRESLLNQKTPSSALTIAQCLIEILHAILIDHIRVSQKGPVKSVPASLSKDGALRRMKLFEIATGNCNYKNWQNLLVDVFQKFQPEANNWELPPGEKREADCTVEDLLMGKSERKLSILTEQSLSEALEEVLPVMKLFTTLTSTNSITNYQIFTCLKAARIIGALICRLSGSCPCSLQAVSSFLTLNQEITNYARQASTNLFEQLGGIHSWGDLYAEAEYTEFISRHIGNSGRPPAAVLFDGDGGQRHIEQVEKKRAEIAGTLNAGAGKRRGAGIDPDNLVINALTATGVGTCGADDNQAQAGHLIPVITHTLTGNGHNASEDGTGRGTPLVPCWWDGGQVSQTLDAVLAKGQTMPEKNRFPAVLVPQAFMPGQGAKAGSTGYGPVSPTLKSSNSGTNMVPAVVFPLNQITSKLNGANPKLGDPAPTLNSDTNNMLLVPGVRRITPLEAERLQGFYDGYTNIPGASDTARYKAIGNSMAVPVMAWLGKRIQLVDDFLQKNV